MSFQKSLLIASVSMILVSQAMAFSVMFVDDDDYYNNEPHVLNAVDASGVNYALFDCQVEERSPMAQEMADFDLVIWYSANDGSGLYFWNHDDTVNQEIISYLQDGGCFWYMGNDALYDMYGGAPDVFMPGDFPYDYMGIASYNVQSHVDDNGGGVPQLDVEPGNPVTDLTPVNWKYAGLWYADGVTPADYAQPIYRMGPETYELAGEISGLLFDNGQWRFLSYLFDPYFIVHNDGTHIEMLAELITDGLDYFETQCGGGTTDIPEMPLNFELGQNYPNPFNPSTRIDFRLADAANVALTVFDVNGVVVANLVNGELPAGVHSVSFDAADLASGVYYYQLTAAGEQQTRKMLLVK